MEIDFMPDPSTYQRIPFSITPEKAKEMNIFGSPTRYEPFYLLENIEDVPQVRLTEALSEIQLQKPLKSCSDLKSMSMSCCSLTSIKTGSISSSSTSSASLNSLSSVNYSSSASSLTIHFKCELCRKTFLSEATYNNHQNTSKHKAMVEKDRINKNQKTNKKSNSKKKNLKKKATKEKLKITTSYSQTALEALKKVGQAEKIKKTHPSIAANVFWNAATILWSCNLPQDTASILHQLLIILLKHENRVIGNNIPKSNSMSIKSSLSMNKTENRNTKPAQPPELTSAQISHTVYLSCIALARLISENYYSKTKGWKEDEEENEDEENASLEATSLYLLALKERFGLNIESVQEFSDLLTTTAISYSQFIENCNILMKKCNPVAIITKKSHPAFYQILSEVASYHSRLRPDHLSLVLYGIASVHSAKEERWNDYVDTNKRLCKVFNSIEEYWLSTECLLDTSKGTDIQLICMALILSIRIDDRVNSKKIEKIIEKLYKESNKEIPLDIQYLLNLSKCVRTCDHIWLDEESEIKLQEIDGSLYIPNDKNSDSMEEKLFSKISFESIEELYNIVKDRMN